MKAKINKQTLLGKGYNKGFLWLDRYSKTETTDDMGRWARVGYYNGFMIAWINGVNKTKEGADNRSVSICDLFISHLFFPCSSNQGGETKNFENIEDAKKWSEEMFNDFKKLIN